MTEILPHAHNADLDLLLERELDVPVARVWAAWTQPELLKQWFTPAPWSTVDCEMDLRPGGIFRTVMRSPEGEEFPGVGCFLEIVEQRKLVWTDALLPGYRPSNVRPGDAAHCGLPSFMSVVISMEPIPGGTRYRALAIHRDAEGATTHARMGFHEGWGAALDQLVAMIKAQD